MDDVFSSESFVTSIIWQKVDSPNDNKVPITPDHEYVLCFSNTDPGQAFRRKPDVSLLDAYRNTDADGARYRDRLLKKNGKNSMREDRPTMYFPITDPDGNEVLPLHDSGRPACWAAGRSAVEVHKTNGTLIWKRRVVAGTERWEPYTREYAPQTPLRPYPTIWDDVKTTRQSKKHLHNLGLLGIGFDTPKPTQLIERMMAMSASEGGWFLDFFAGSGTTGDAVIGHRRETGDDWRFILAEMGTYFDSMVLPRLQKVMHAPAWKDGAPAPASHFETLSGDLSMLPDWVGRTPRLVQVLRLESYETSLNALETPNERTARQQMQAEIFGDDYLLRYALPLETAASAPLLDLRAMDDPFAYRLRVHTPDGVTEQPVDLVETFPLVMGLRPVRRWTAMHATDGAERRYVLMEARARDGGLALVVWRAVAGLDPAAEKAWLAAELAARGRTWDAYTVVWMNAQGALPRGRELDTAFRDALLARDPHVARTLAPDAGDGLSDAVSLVA